MGKYAILDTDTSKLGEWTNIKSVFTKTNSGESSNVLLGTGISEYTNRMNIYDFSGNEWEWILEKYYDSYDPCARSGGDYCHSGSYSPAANRSYYSTTKRKCPFPKRRKQTLFLYFLLYIPALFSVLLYSFYNFQSNFINTFT